MKLFSMELDPTKIRSTVSKKPRTLRWFLERSTSTIFHFPIFHHPPLTTKLLLGLVVCGGKMIPPGHVKPDVNEVPAVEMGCPWGERPFLLDYMTVKDHFRVGWALWLVSYPYHENHRFGAGV